MHLLQFTIIKGYHKNSVSDQVFAFCRVFGNIVGKFNIYYYIINFYSNILLGIFAINIGPTPHVFHLDLSPVQNVYAGEQIEVFEVMDVLNPSTPAKPLHYISQDDLVNWKYLYLRYFIYHLNSIFFSPRIAITSRNITILAS